MTCQFAGGCSRLATVTVRIARIGDRPVCSQHRAWMERTGMDFRVLEPSAAPAWRQRDLAKDLTGVA